ncbi:hypothetical protein FRACA_960011 [Frankia canadensis]|uniref:Uncharacterized protein n=1 Tax=Frankia canadensis TaxID=1836972 RepID=A0A2I2L2T1_9ACTN|nr:hypothetical protein FRACA_960011 [Frankia canadensis]SOU59498.1 hypothetical protein FRACA_960011 [Frankia canadensis]
METAARWCGEKRSSGHVGKESGTKNLSPADRELRVGQDSGIFTPRKARLAFSGARSALVARLLVLA